MARDILSRLNPFTDDYLRSEIKFYDMHDEYQFGDLKVKQIHPIGRCDDYLNVAMHIEKDIIAPTLIVDRVLWMSLTWMEVQSLYVPIRRAKGRVGVVGLGLGYSTLAMMEKEDVDEVIVFEIDPRVVWFFQIHFKHRKGYEKLRIITGDALLHCRGFEFDFFFCDRYATICSDEMFEDVEHFRSKNTIHVYHPWCLELCYFTAMTGGYIGVDEVPIDILELFTFWANGPGANLRAPMHDIDFAMEIVEEVGDGKLW